MNLFILIIIGIAVLILLFLVNSALLSFVCKIFKVTSANFKTSLLISLLEVVIGLVVGLIVAIFANIIGLQLLGQLLMIIAEVVIFHFLLNRFYKTKFLKNLGIFVVLQIFIVIFSLALIIPIRYLVFQPFYIKGAAMEPTFQDHDYILIKMYDKSYQRGDILVFRYPKDLSQYFIKRIVGLPGEKVSFAGGKVLINGKVLDESSYLAKGEQTEAIGTQEFTLGSDEYFVLGDNRTASLDSRRFGPISKNLIIGKYWFMGFKANTK